MEWDPRPQWSNKFKASVRVRPGTLFNKPNIRGAPEGRFSRKVGASIADENEHQSLQGY